MMPLFWHSLIFIYTFLTLICNYGVNAQTCADDTWTQSSTGRCFKGFNFLNALGGSDENDHWKVADQYCYSKFRTRLATIYNDDEDKLVKEASMAQGGDCWIGLRKYRIVSSKGWWWTDGMMSLKGEDYTSYSPDLKKIWLWLPPYEKCGIYRNSGWDIRNCKWYRDQAECFVCGTPLVDRPPEMDPPVREQEQEEVEPEPPVTSTEPVGVDAAPFIPYIPLSTSTTTTTTTTTTREREVVVIPSSTTTTTTTTTTTSTTTRSNSAFDSCELNGTCGNDQTRHSSTPLGVTSSTTKKPVDRPEVATADVNTNNEGLRKNNANKFKMEYIGIIVGGLAALSIIALIAFCCCGCCGFCLGKKATENANDDDEDKENDKTKIDVHEAASGAGLVQPNVQTTEMHNNNKNTNSKSFRQLSRLQTITDDNITTQKNGIAMNRLTTEQEDLSLSPHSDHLPVLAAISEKDLSQLVSEQINSSPSAVACSGTTRFAAPPGRSGINRNEFDDQVVKQF